jgi:hypothetical protein
MAGVWLSGRQKSAKRGFSRAPDTHGILDIGWIWMPQYPYPKKRLSISYPIVSISVGSLANPSTAPHERQENQTANGLCFCSMHAATTQVKFRMNGSGDYNIQGFDKPPQKCMICIGAQGCTSNDAVLFCFTHIYTATAASTS